MQTLLSDFARRPAAGIHPRMATRPTPKAPSQTLRADARRNLERILDAAVEQFGQDSEASMAAVARRAGVARATLYAHFPTREALIAAATDRAIAEAAAALGAAAVDEGDPAAALARMLAAAWRALGRYRALAAINTRLPAARLRALHEPVLGTMRPLLERGQASGAFNPDVPVDWLLTVVLELVHAACRDVSGGRLPEEVGERALLASVTGALSPPAR
jgi:TetR/AcrR family transcriptional regulator, mexCD-oprJ operon repressor